MFIDALRELPATLILRPFNLETLATRTYRLASDERLVEASMARISQASARRICWCGFRQGCRRPGEAAFSRCASE